MDSGEAEAHDKVAMEEIGPLSIAQEKRHRLLRSARIAAASLHEGVMSKFTKNVVDGNVMNWPVCDVLFQAS